MDVEQITQEELDEIERLDGEATPGPWPSEAGWNNGGTPSRTWKVPARNDGLEVEMLVGDALFVERARALLPRLARAYRAILTDLQEAAGELLVDMPKPGTVTAKLLLANVIMRRERDNARSAQEVLKSEARQAYIRGRREAIEEAAKYLRSQMCAAHAKTILENEEELSNAR